MCIISIYPHRDRVFLSEVMCLMSSVCSLEPVTACQSLHLLLICCLGHTAGKGASQIADRQTGRQKGRQTDRQVADMISFSLC